MALAWVTFSDGMSVRGYALASCLARITLSRGHRAPMAAIRLDGQWITRPTAERRTKPSVDDAKAWCDARLAHLFEKVA